MYAIVEDGGKQYKLEAGKRVCVELRELEEGQEQLQFDKVLYLKDGESIQVGQPLLAGASVTGKILHTLGGPKLFPMHHKRRKNSRRRIGHKQKYLEVEITEIVKPS